MCQTVTCPMRSSHVSVMRQQHVGALHHHCDCMLRCMKSSMLCLPTHAGRLYLMQIPHLWPAQVMNDHTLSYYWAPQPGHGCGGYQRSAADALRPFGLLSSLSFPARNQFMAVLSGSHRLSQHCVDMYTNTTGGGPFLSSYYIQWHSLRRPAASVTYICIAPYQPR